MLKKLTLENYRGYERHEVDFRDLTIIVGKNNAGKSTLVEALRLLSLVTNKYKNAPYRDVPDWLEIALFNTGISPSLQRMDFSYNNLFFNNLDESTAKITAEFKNNTKVEIYFGGEKKFHAVLFDENGFVCPKIRLNELNLPTINILPQITPLLSDEKLLNPDYVIQNIDSYTSSRHFRNQLKHFREYYKEFKELVESTWDGLRIVEYSGGNMLERTNPYLLVQDAAFATEIGYMGHGLQMWMQTMWFLARCKPNATVILDEPDVYMHADLQRKMVRLLKNQFNQVVIATHSIEIMSEVEPENILVIDRKKEKSIFASDFNGVQKILLNMGSIHNIALARLWSARKILMVEGKDVDLLKRFQNTLFKKSKEPLAGIPSISIGGWGGWSKALGSKIILKNAGNENIVAYCILDSDYHSKDEINLKYKEAKANDVNLKIWEKKEIENYLIVPSAIHRIIKKQSSYSISIKDVEDAIENFAEEMKGDYEDILMDKISLAERQAKRHIEPSTAKKRAKEQLKNEWDNKLSLLSGKSLITKINNWCNEKFNVFINANKLAQELTESEIDNELKIILTKIERKEKF